MCYFQNAINSLSILVMVNIKAIMRRDSIFGSGAQIVNTNLPNFFEAFLQNLKNRRSPSTACFGLKYSISKIKL